jgi:hypothetical protein
MSTTTASLLREGVSLVENKDIRQALVEAGFKHWELAEALGIYEGNLSRKLRRELPSEQKEHIFRTIERMKEYRSERSEQK